MLGERLINLGIEKSEAAAEAEIILRTATGFSAAEIILQGSAPLSDAAVQKIDDIIARRARREPLQHILGESIFMGLPFKVSADVLVPRPETELLVEAAVEIIQGEDFFLAHLPGTDGRCRRGRILEIGAGSGAICLSILRNCPAVTAVAYEVSPAAAAVCQSNAHDLGVAERLELRVEDFLGLAEIAGKIADATYDLFVSNPPYIPAALLEGLAPEVRDFEPDLALRGLDSDGLGFYRAFARFLPTLAAPTGAVLLAEFGEGQGPEIAATFTREHWLDVCLLPDLSGKDRILKARLPARGL